MSEIQFNCAPGDLDTVKQEQERKGNEYTHFTVRRGKAKYHMLNLPNGSCGLYYAVRVGIDGYPETMRAIEPTTFIICSFNTLNK